MNRKTLLIAAILFPALVERAVAQVEPTAALRLHPGQAVRIRLQNGQRFKARLAAVDSTPPQLRFAGPQSPVPVAAIDSIWLRKRAAGTGALIGGIVGGAGLAALGADVCIGLGEGSFGSCGGTVIIVGLVGAAGGALLGAGIGSLVTRWRLLDATNITVSLGPGATSPTFAARVRF